MVSSVSTSPCICVLCAKLFPANRPCAGLGCSAALATPTAVGVLHYTKPSGGVSPACRSLMSCNSPQLVVVRPPLTAVSCPKCRPPRQKPVTTDCCGRGGLRFEHTCVSRGVLLAREPLNMRVNPLKPTSTPQHAPGRSRPRTSHRPTCGLSGPCAGHRSNVRSDGPASDDSDDPKQCRTSFPGERFMP